MIKLLLPAMLFTAILTSNGASADCPGGYHMCGFWGTYCCLNTVVKCKNSKCYDKFGKFVPNGRIKKTPIEKSKNETKEK